jgi:exodeoxyribonuclease VII small subunit
MSAGGKKEKALSFELSMERLEAIAARLENPETGLEETIALVEEGRRLVVSCRKLLEKAELRIKTLDNPASASAVATLPKDEEDGFSLV